MCMYVAKYISHDNNTTRISFVYKYGPYETEMFPANLCMGSHMPIKAKTFIPVFVSKIEQITNFILVKTSQTIAKVSKVLGIR